MVVSEPTSEPDSGSVIAIDSTEPLAMFAEQLVLLLLGAEALDGAGDDQGGRVAADRRHAAGGLLHEEAGVDHGPAGAAVLLGDRQAEPAELGHLLVELLVVELGVAVGELLALLGGAALPLAEVADGGDEVALLVGELEVHGGGSYRFLAAWPAAISEGKPGAGLEPATPSLPWKCSTN